MGGLPVTSIMYYRNVNCETTDDTHQKDTQKLLSTSPSAGPLRHLLDATNATPLRSHALDRLGNHEGVGAR